MPENRQDIGTVITNKPALVTDLDSSYIKESAYTYARNIDKATQDGNLGDLTNNMANHLCLELTYSFLGAITLNNGKFIIFSGDGDINSEIGILDEATCIYEKKINASCLNFKKGNLITGVAKIQDNGDTIVNFRDKENSPRRVNFSRIPYKYKILTDTCETKEPTKELDCSEIDLFPNITIPCITLEENSGGNLPNGTYSALMSYVVDGQIYSDYFSITNRIQLYSKGNLNSFTVNLSNLDRDFDEYSLIIIQDSNTAKTAYNMGTYSTSQEVVSVDDVFSTPTINISDLVIQKRAWAKVGNIAANSNYLILSDLTRFATLNYQPQAMKIKTEYVIKQVPEDYYEKSPKEIGYYRDENYDFAIEWLHAKGFYSNRSHIPGPKKKSEWGALAAGDDVYEIDPLYQVTDKVPLVQRWEVENTANKPTLSNLPFINNERIFAYGNTGYNESTEQYPDNKDLFPNDACQPIRTHRMPDEEKISRYSKIDGKTYINIIGVRFKQIEYPKDPQGKPLPGYIGYRIIRSDRFGGNKTVIARGLASNIRHYNDIQNKREIWYANYPYNDLRPDAYLSSTQTVFKNKKETNFTPLTGVFDNKFAFYTPHAYFQPTYKLGNEFKFEVEEVAEVRGNFEEVTGHPKHKLLTQFAFWFALTLGVLEATLKQTGKKCVLKETSVDGLKTKTGGTDSGFTTQTPTSPNTKTQESYCIQNVSDLAGLNPIDMIKDAIKSGNSGFLGVIKTIAKIIKALAVAGIKVLLFTFDAIQGAEVTLNIINNFTGEIQYAYQYNSHALFNEQVLVTKDNKRRLVISQPERITSNLHTIDSTILNNFGKQNFMLVQTNKGVEFPKTIDNTRETISGFGLCENPRDLAVSTAALFYCTSKIKNKNQYGQVGSSPTVLASSCINNVTFDEKNPDKEFVSLSTFGGDCIITKFAIQTKQPLFRQNLAYEVGNEVSPNFQDNIGYDYRSYRNIGYARYWIDTIKYNFGNLINKKVINFAKFTRTTTAKYNLDCKYLDKENVYRVDNARFYTSVNGVLEFYVESDFNISFREKGIRGHYSKENTNLSDIFKPTKLFFEEEFLLDSSFKRLQTTEFFSIQIPHLFKNKNNDNLANSNAVIYSLPSFNSAVSDNWRYFLPNNYFTFSKSDYGNLTAVHKIDQDRLIYLFDRSSPFVSPGRDELQTLDGRKVQIGDGGLFARDPRETQPTDVNYGSCQSKHAFSSNQFGYFYPSEYHGRHFKFSQSLEDITRKGMYYWHKKFMPIQLFELFSDYPKEENPISGVGYLSTFDSNYELLYLSKRDFIPKDQFKADIIYNKIEKRFEFKGIPIELRSDYFEDISWTLAYSPADEAFLSWYDWHPDWTIQTEKHFMSVKGKGIWKHNENNDLFCNYYNVDYPCQIEIVDTDGQLVSSRRNLEYQIEAYHYRNNGRDKFHVLNQNFDSLVVYNTEQMSPALSLIANPQTKYGANDYPKKVGNRWEVLFSKEENKYRVNQFWDAVKDRGEFSLSEQHLWHNHPSGYKRIQNPNALDIDKPEEQRKKFRHYLTKFLFSKDISGNNKFLIRLFNIKKQQSNR